MTVIGGMTKMRNTLRDDPDTQKLYSHLMSGGLSPGHSGKDVFCNTMSSPYFSAKCNGGKLKPGKFEKFAGPWKDLKAHK